MTFAEQNVDRAKTGIWGLDDILTGGFTRQHVFLVEGAPGTGKTTIALQFLLEGARAGETCLYITLSETEAELRGGCGLARLDAGRQASRVFELLPPESLLDSEQQQSLLYSSDLELGETTKQIFEAVEKRARPRRVVFDSLSEIRLLAQSSLRYRRQILALKHYFARLGTTVLMLDDLTAELADKTVHSVAHGVVATRGTGADLWRGAAAHARHQVSRRKVSRRLSRRHDHHRRVERVPAPGGVRASLARSSAARCRAASPVSMGCSAAASNRDRARSFSGRRVRARSLIAIIFVASRHRARRKGGAVRLRRGTRLLFSRMKGLGIDLDAMQRRGNLLIEQVDAAELSPGEFAHRVREAGRRRP